MSSEGGVESERQAARALWDEAAASFDEEADHGLRPAPVLAAWTRLLEKWLPEKSADILDVGCGTGSLSAVMAGLGHRVTGVDLSPKMIERASEKAAERGFLIDFQVMNAAELQFPPHSFDILVCRHVLWALGDTAEALRDWVKLVRGDGRLILVEGFWETGAGLHSAEIVEALPDSVKLVAVEDLSGRSEFWGKQVADERYIVIVEKVL